MNLEAMIKKMLLEGKSDLEISEAIIADAKGSKLSADDIAQKILAAKKQEEVKAKLEADKKAAEEIEAKKKEKDELDKKVKVQVEEALKGIKVNGLNGFQLGRNQLKRFDLKTKQMIEIIEPSEAYMKCNEMFYALANGRPDIAGKLSEEISQDNARIRKQYGIKAANDPVRSDSDAAGGYAVPAEVEESITQMLYTESLILKHARVDQIIANSKIFPTIYGIDVVEITNQATAVTESQPTFTNPTISMVRTGGYTNISNTIIRQKGADIVNAILLGYTAALARYIDKRAVCGNVTGQSHLLDGMIFDPNTVQETTPIALSALDVTDLQAMFENISADAGNLMFWCNRKVAGVLGLSENTGGMYTFPQYVAGGALSPLGIPLVVNKQIISTLAVAEDNWGGTDNAIVLCDMDKFIVGLDQETRFDLSKDFRFTNDVTTFRAIKELGWKVLISTTVSTGGSCRVLELTA